MDINDLKINAGMNPFLDIDENDINKSKNYEEIDKQVRNLLESIKREVL